MAAKSNFDTQTDFQHAIAMLQAPVERKRETGAQTLITLLQVKSLLADVIFISIHCETMTTIAHGQRLILQLLLALQSQPVLILLHDPNQSLHSLIPLICVLCHQDSNFSLMALDLLPILMPVLEARTREEPAEEVLVSVFKILETVLTKAEEANCSSNSPIRCLNPT